MLDKINQCTCIGHYWDKYLALVTFFCNATFHMAFKRPLWAHEGRMVEYVTLDMKISTYIYRHEFTNCDISFQVGSGLWWNKSRLHWPSNAVLQVWKQHQVCQGQWSWSQLPLPRGGGGASGSSPCQQSVCFCWNVSWTKNIHFWLSLI